MTTIRTNLASRYLPVSIEYAGSINENAKMPWVPDFDSLGSDFAGVLCLEHDLGNFEAGIYLEVVAGEWRLVLPFKDVYTYMVGGDNDLRVIFQPPSTNAVPDDSTVFVNGNLSTVSEISPSAYNIYAILKRRSGVSSTSPNGLSDNPTELNPSVSSQDIPLAFSGSQSSYLGTPTNFRLLVGPEGEPLLDSQGNRQVIPVYSIDNNGNFI